MQAIIWILFFVLAVLGLSLVWSTFRYGISPMPTSPKVKNILLKELPETFTGTIYELGSGWGTLAFSLAEKYPQAQVIGYEISLVPYLFARFRNFLNPQKNLFFKRLDFIKCDLSGAQFYVCYLYPGAMAKLSDKLSREAPPGSFLASHTFALPGQKPVRTIAIHDLYHTPIYFYLLNKK